jgi:hypothetical protein
MEEKDKAQREDRASTDCEINLNPYEITLDIDGAKPNLNAASVDRPKSTKGFLKRKEDSSSGTKRGDISSETKEEDSSSGTKIKLLDEAPQVMRRPLMMMKGHTYAAAMPFVEIEQAVTTDANGNVITHNPPLKTKKRVLAVIRDDGKVFYHGLAEFGKLGFSVELPELPRDEKLFSQQGLKKYEGGERISPRILFEQLCEVVDAFIDFNQSLGTQREMCEFIACFILATWFVEAFNVVPFLWIDGDKGSGKTQLATLISRLGFLGQMLLSSGSFASLRDLGDNGACLCFDEAENLDSPKAEPYKREILLAGNKRGSTVTLKKPGKDNKWETQYVNMFCPRVFSAIERPDSVLGSRAIIIPMVRTLDGKKGNADIWDLATWPHVQGKLLDSLWSVALANFSQLSSFDSKVKELSPLVGRALEPWRAILAVALWLESKGVIGIGERMNKLSLSYQKQRETVETEDLSSLIIRAICKILKCEVVRLGEACEVGKGSVPMRTGEIELQAQLIALDMELDIDPQEITSLRIGRKLSQQRFEKKREGGTGKARWKIDRKRLNEWASASGLIAREKGESQ